MAIRRRCRGSCRNGRRCMEHLWLDVKYRAARYRMQVNEFAVPRMEPGKQRPIQSMEEARDWERLFIGEIKAGRDPRIKPALKSATRGSPERCGFPGRLFRATPETCRNSQPRYGCRAHQGSEEVFRRTSSQGIGGTRRSSITSRQIPITRARWRSRRSTRCWRSSRAAIRWGQAQTPPLIEKSPFHRFGVRLNQKAETVRDRRISREEEKRLLDAALTMNAWEHRYVGPLHARSHHRRARALLPAW